METFAEGFLNQLRQDAEQRCAGQKPVRGFTMYECEQSDACTDLGKSCIGTTKSSQITAQWHDGKCHLKITL